MSLRISIISLCLLLLACQSKKEEGPIDVPPAENEIIHSVETKELNNPEQSQPPKPKKQTQAPPSPAKKKTPSPSVKKGEKKMAIIKFDFTFHRLDTMNEGDVVDIEFRFWNTGDAPLSIDEVDVTCGCTIPSIPFLDIQPGDTSKIDIQYKSVGKSGLQEPEIIIKTNGAPTYTKLKLEVFVIEHGPDPSSENDTLSN